MLRKLSIDELGYDYACPPPEGVEERGKRWTHLPVRADAL